MEQCLDFGTYQKGDRCCFIHACATAKSHQPSLSASAHKVKVTFRAQIKIKA